MAGRRKIRKLLIGAAVLSLVVTACTKAENTNTEVQNSTEETAVSNQNETDNKAIAFTVDGYPVSYEEFSLFVRNQRSAAAQYFYEAYGADGGEDFWVTEYEGETPSEYCKKMALEETIEYKMERILAYERGLVEHVDYDDLMGDMEQLNEKNRERTAGQISYGLMTYEPWQYLLYIRSDCVTQLLKDAAERCEESISEESLQARYEEEKENYHKGYDVTYERLDVFSLKDGYTVEEALNAVKSRAAEGESLNDAAADLNLFEDYVAEEKISSEEYAGKDDLWGQWIQTEAQKLEEGMVSEPFVVSENAGSLLRCIKKTSLGYVSFEDAKDDIIGRYAEESLKEELNRRMEGAEVVFPNDIYEQITVE